MSHPARRQLDRQGHGVGLRPPEVKFTLAGITAGIKLVDEGTSVALFDHDGGGVD